MKRTAAAVTIAIAIVLFRAGTAAADARQVTSWTASHDAIVEGDRITWRTLYVGNDAGGARGELRVDLASPLRALPEDVHGSHLIRVERDGVGITAFVFADDPSWRDAIDVSVVQRIGDRGNVTLAPPLERGDGVQVVTVNGADDMQFEPSRATALVRHVGYVAPDDVDTAARTQCDDLLGRHFQPSATPIYVRGTSRVASDGLVGKLETAAERSKMGFLGAGIAFIAIAIALALGYQRLNSTARAEQAEAVLREEFARDERDARARARSRAV